MSSSTPTSKRLTYYDFGKNETLTRVFNTVEVQLIDEIFETIEVILLKNNLSVGDKYIETGPCGCKKHDNVYLMIEVKTNALFLDTIHRVEQALLKYHVEFVSISSRYREGNMSIVFGTSPMYDGECPLEMTTRNGK